MLQVVRSTQEEVVSLGVMPGNSIWGDQHGMYSLNMDRKCCLLYCILRINLHRWFSISQCHGNSCCHEFIYLYMTTCNRFFVSPDKVHKQKLAYFWFLIIISYITTSVILFLSHDEQHTTKMTHLYEKISITRNWHFKCPAYVK